MLYFLFLAAVVFATGGVSEGLCTQHLAPRTSLEDRSLFLQIAYEEANQDQPRTPADIRPSPYTRGIFDYSKPFPEPIEFSRGQEMAFVAHLDPQEDGDVAQAVDRIAKDLRNALPDRKKIFIIEPAMAHVSVSTLQPFGTLSFSPEELRQTEAALAAVTSRSSPFRIRFSRLFITKDGAIILCGFADNQEIFRIRQDLAGRIPFQRGETPVFIHATLGRILADSAGKVTITQEELDRLKAVVQKYDGRLIAEWHVKELAWIEARRSLLAAVYREIRMPLGSRTLLSDGQKILEFLAQQDALPAQPVDLVLLLGNRQIETVTVGADLYRRGLAKRIFVSGSVSKRPPPFNETELLRRKVKESDYGVEDVDTKTEAEIFRDILISCGVPRAVIGVEKEARDSKENIVFTKKILEEEGISHKTVIVVQNPLFQRRAMATFARWFGAGVKAYAYAPYVPDIFTMSEQDRHYFLINAVGEFDRFEKYAEKRDIVTVNVPAEIKECVRRVSDALRVAEARGKGIERSDIVPPKVSEKIEKILNGERVGGAAA